MVERPPVVKIAAFSSNRVWKIGRIAWNLNPEFIEGYGNPQPSPDSMSGKVQRLGEYTFKHPSPDLSGYDIVQAWLKFQDFL